MRWRVYILLGSATSVALFFLWPHYPTPPVHNRPAERDKIEKIEKIEKIAKNPMPSQFPVLSDLSKSTTPVASDPAMIDLLRRSGSIREFIEAAKRLPSKDGFLWSAEAAKLCDGYRFMLSRHSVNQLPEAWTQSHASKVVEINLAAFKITDTCNGVMEASSYVPSLVSEGHSLGDRSTVRFQNREDLEKAGNYQEAMRMKVIEHNPIELAMPWNDFFYGGKDGPSPMRAYFDGKWYVGTEVKNLSAALSLTACDFGFPCDSGRFEVEYSCARYALCFRSYEELLKSFASQDPDMNVELILGLRQQITGALRGGMVDAFLPEPTTRINLSGQGN